MSLPHIYSVVRFISEDTVELVPSNWIHDNKCYFPNEKLNDAQYLKLVKERAKPENSWSRHKIKILGSYDKFNVALQKSKKAVDTDDLASNVEEKQSKRKRKINKKYINSDSSSGDTNSDTSSSDENSVTAPKIGKVNVDQPAKPSLFKNKTENLSAATTVTITPQGSSSSNTDILPTTYSTPTHPEGEFEKQVIRNLIIIKSILSTHTENFNVLLKNIAPSPTEGTVVGDLHNEELQRVLKNLPIQNMEQLQDTETFLNDTNNFNAFYRELSRHGGHSASSMTKSLMYSILTNKIGQLYSWEGAKGKFKFKKLHLSRAILYAVRFHRKNTYEGDELVKTTIKKWLARAKERADHEKKNDISQH